LHRLPPAGSLAHRASLTTPSSFTSAADKWGGGLNTDHESRYRSDDNMAGVSAAKYVTDDAGTRIGVLIGIDDYRGTLEDEEELAYIRAYDAAKSSGDEAIPFEQAIKEIEIGSG